MTLNFRRVISLLPVLASIFVIYQVAPAALAQDAAERHLRVIYTNENAPPEIRFKMLLARLSYGENRRDRSFRYSLEQIGFDHNDVPAVAAYLETVRDEIDVESSRSRWRIACGDDAPNLTGSNIRSVYNSLDDLSQGIHAKYLAIASAELAAMNYPDFRDMLNGLNGSFIVSRTNHRYGWGAVDDGIQQNRTKLCASIKKYSTVTLE